MATAVRPSAFSFTAIPRDDPLMALEVERIVEVVEEAGVITRRELAARIGAGTWHPVRFTRALNAAVVGGGILRVGRNRFAGANGRLR